MFHTQCDSLEEMRQARLKMPQRSSEQAWAQHDAAEKACQSFGRESVLSSTIISEAPEESSKKTRR
jgi:hypothetical protein